MPTDGRSITSPVNGRKSTGPKTTEGKQAPGLTGESKPTRAALAFRTLQRYVTLRARASVNLPFEPTFSLVPDTPSPRQTPSEQTI